MTFGPYGVGRLDGKAVMVPHAAPGDLLEVTVVQERGGYLIARAERVLKAGAARRTPPCPYLPRCGGCDWQQIAYSEQTRFKAQVIAATLNHALGLELNPATLIEPAPAEFGYRARIRFKTGRGGRLGFYEAGSRRRTTHAGRALVSPRRTRHRSSAPRASAEAARPNRARRCAADP